MAAVLDRVVPSRRKERDRLRQLGDRPDSRFGDTSISAPHAGGWSQPSNITTLYNAWEQNHNRLSTEETISPLEGCSNEPDNEYGRIIIVDDTNSPHEHLSPDTIQDKGTLIFNIPRPWGVKKPHSRNPSVGTEQLAPTPPPIGSNTPPVIYKPIRDQYMLEYATLGNHPWSHQREDRTPDPVPRPPSPAECPRIPSTSPPPVTHSPPNAFPPPSLEYARASPAPPLGILSPVSENFAKDDPRHQRALTSTPQPFSSRTSPPIHQSMSPPLMDIVSRMSPQPPNSQSPALGESQNSHGRSLPSNPSPPAPLAPPPSSSVDAWNRTRSRSQSRSRVQFIEKTLLPRSRSVDVYDPRIRGSAGSPFQPTQPIAPAAPTPQELIEAHPMAPAEYSTAAWDPMIRSRTPLVPRPATSDGFRHQYRAGTPPQPISSLDRFRAVDVAYQNGDLDPAQFGYIKRPQATGRGRTRSEDPPQSRFRDDDDEGERTPRQRGRSRSISTSRRDQEHQPGRSASRGAPAREHGRSVSRGRGPMGQRNYMTYEDLDPEDIPLPASRAPSRPSSRAASCAARDRAPSRTGRRELSRPRAPSRPRFIDRNGYYNTSDGDVNTSSSEDDRAWEIPTSRPSSRRPSTSAVLKGLDFSPAVGYMITPEMKASEEFRAEVKREAEYLIRTMRVAGTDDEIARWSLSSDDHRNNIHNKSNVDNIVHGNSNNISKEALKKIDRVGTVNNTAAQHHPKEELVPDADQLWW